MALTKKEESILKLACGSIKRINHGKPIGYTARTPEDYDKAVDLLSLLSIRHTKEDHSSESMPFYIIIRQDV